MTSLEKDNRRDPRIIREDTLSLRPIDSERRSSREETSVYCASVDVSASGMQILLSDPIPLNQLVEVWIVLTDNLGTYNLIGKINRLVELDDPDETDGFLAGLELLDQSPDIRAWRELF